MWVTLYVVSNFLLFRGQKSFFMRIIMYFLFTFLCFFQVFENRYTNVPSDDTVEVATPPPPQNPAAAPARAQNPAAARAPNPARAQNPAAARAQNPAAARAQNPSAARGLPPTVPINRAPPTVPQNAAGRSSATTSKQIPTPAPPKAVTTPVNPTERPQRELRPHPPQLLNVDNSDSDSDTTRDKNDWYQRLLQVKFI